MPAIMEKTRRALKVAEKGCQEQRHCPELIVREEQITGDVKRLARMRCILEIVQKPTNGGVGMIA